MKFTSISKVFAVAVASTVLMTASASAGDWKLLGKKNVKDRVETDTINLNGPRRFNKIKICVYRNPVSFKDVDVYFANNGHQDIKLRKRINAGDCTRAIDLKWFNRDIDRIVMRYEETSVRRATATVRVFGK